MRIAGVDGCRGGWVAVCTDVDLSNPRIEPVPVFEQLPDAFGGWPDVVAVDMPVGLVEDWDRTPEPEARQLLGPHRRSSVFPSPPRQLLNMFSASHTSGEQAYNALNAWSRRATGKGLQRQTFNLLGKISEIDAVLKSDQAPPGIFEVHPELSFRAMNGERSMQFSKRDPSGREERRRVLSRHLPSTLLELERPVGCTGDDYLDALAALWSASRIATGESARVGACEDDPVLHRTIAIWY